MAHPRLEASSIRKQYGARFLTGLALSLACLLVISHLPLTFDKNREPSTRKREPTALRSLQATAQASAPPPPPTPVVPQVVPRENVLESPSVNFDFSLSLDVNSDPGGGGTVRPDCGGLRSLQKKTHYPPSALMEGLEGRVIVEFIVAKDGNIESPKVADGSHEVLNQAALRAVRRLKCTPGRKRSRPVRAKITQMVVFALPERIDAS
jgi:TonB family protein